MAMSQRTPSHCPAILPTRRSSLAAIAGCHSRAAGYPASPEGFNAASTVGVGPVNGWSVAFFGGIGGHAIAHYLPLDGTVFKDSRSVDTEPFVGNTSIGVALRRGGFALSLAATFSLRRSNAAGECPVRDLEHVLVLLVESRHVSRKKATRRMIVDAALELFTTRGYDGTNMESISVEANKSPR